MKWNNGSDQSLRIQLVAKFFRPLWWSILIYNQDSTTIRSYKPWCSEVDLPTTEPVRPKWPLKYSLILLTPPDFPYTLRHRICFYKPNYSVLHSLVNYKIILFFRDSCFTALIKELYLLCKNRIWSIFFILTPATKSHSKSI